MSTKKSPEFKPVRMPRLPEASTRTVAGGKLPATSEFALAEESTNSFDPYNTAAPFVAPRDRKS
jgi:hypothetical protein